MTITEQGAPTEVAVALGERAYRILIGPGLLRSAGEWIAPLAKGRRRVAVVTDETVGATHLPALSEGLAGAGFEAEAITLPPGEATKSMDQLAGVLDRLLDMKIQRDDLIIALGGGVIGDLTGFAAAILRRGVRFIQIPTSLLAQVDSSVGGKTGINARQGKNLIGAFHQPSLVLADIDVLETLPERELKAGYAEVAKYGLLGDRAFFEWLEANGAAVLGGDAAARTEAVRASCAAKAAIVARDETETGDRALLNLGHTFGHALEAATGYSQRLIHGEAVSIGMTLAADFSTSLGLCPGQDAARARAHLEALGLKTGLSDIDGELPDADALLGLMAQDKKARDGRLALVLMRGIGESFLTRDVDASGLRAFLANALAAR